MTHYKESIVFLGALDESGGIDLFLTAFGDGAASLKARYLIDYSAPSASSNEDFVAKIRERYPDLDVKPFMQDESHEGSVTIVPARWFGNYAKYFEDVSAPSAKVLAFRQPVERELPNLMGRWCLLDEISAASLIEGVAELSEAVPAKEGILGVVTTWRQECGLAKVAESLVEHLATGTYHILGEISPDVDSKLDEPFVTRCWQRGSKRYEKLLNTVKSENIKALLLNIHTAKFFSYPEFSSCLSELRDMGVTVVLYLHSTYSADRYLQELLCHVDHTIVHTPQNRLVVLANGAAPDQVSVITHAVTKLPELTEGQIASLRGKYGVKRDQKLLFSFGFIQPHKGMEALAEAVAELTKEGVDVQGIVAGPVKASVPGSKEYGIALINHAKALGVESRMRFLQDYIPDDEINDLLRIADVVLINYSSQHFESSGVCSRAVGSGAVVVTSLAPAFWGFDDAVWHITSGYPPVASIRLALLNEKIRDELQSKARQFTSRNTWEITAKRFLRIFEMVGFRPSTLMNSAEFTPEVGDKKESRVTIKQGLGMTYPQSGLKQPKKVLFQNRDSTFELRGGDTMVIERYKAGLERAGWSVTVDVKGTEDPANYDIVHLFNFVLPQMVKQYGERAKARKVPFVVTTLVEDIPSFRNQSLALASTMVNYVATGQNKDWLRANWPDIARIASSAPFDNSWTVANAAALFTNGPSESETLKSYYGELDNICELKLGYDQPQSASPDMFIEQFGIRDFVLCVGRIESRKNQLMLLKALEDIDLPVVIAGGGFSYQPDYEQAVLNFKRKGQTLVTPRLSPEMLASAYAAARVHALPSWYELPGLVSLEAAYLGCNVVAADRGTARDYLGDTAIYCEPESEGSIRNAVLAAYYMPKRQAVPTHILELTWDRAIEGLIGAYERVLSANNAVQVNSEVGITRQQVRDVRSDQQVSSGSMNYSSSVNRPGVTQVSAPNSQGIGQPLILNKSYTQESFGSIMKRVEAEAEAGNLAEALRLLDVAEGNYPMESSLWRNRGAIFLSQSKTEEAMIQFQRAIQLNPHEGKALVGMALCESFQGRQDSAYQYLVRATDDDCTNLIAIRELIRISHHLNRFTDLKDSLERYLELYPQDLEMRFCLAGTEFKMERYSDAQRNIEIILKESVDHLGANQLKPLIAAKLQESKRPGQLTVNAETQIIEDEAAFKGVTNWSTSASQNSQGASFDPNAVELLIADLEEEKRQRSYESVIFKAEEILRRDGISDEMRERAQVLKAEAYVLKGEAAIGEQIIAEVLAENPLSSRAMCCKGAITAGRNEWAAAENIFRQAYEVSPNNDVALAGLGLCSQWSKDITQAWNWYMKALTYNPENLRALMGVVEIGYQLGRLQEVELAIKQYLEFHPADLEFLYSLAGCYYAQEKLVEATSEIEKITIFEPNNSRALELKSMIDNKLRQSENWV